MALIFHVAKVLNDRTLEASNQHITFFFFPVDKYCAKPRLNEYVLLTLHNFLCKFGYSFVAIRLVFIVNLTIKA